MLACLAAGCGLEPVELSPAHALGADVWLDGVTPAEAERVASAQLESMPMEELAVRAPERDATLPSNIGLLGVRWVDKRPPPKGKLMALPCELVLTAGARSLRAYGRGGSMQIPRAAWGSLVEGGAQLSLRLRCARNDALTRVAEAEVVTLGVGPALLAGEVYVWGAGGLAVQRVPALDPARPAAFAVPARYGFALAEDCSVGLGVAEGGALVALRDGPTAARLPALGAAADLGLSPDGTRLAVADGPTLSVYDVASGALLGAAAGLGELAAPVFSQDGSALYVGVVAGGMPKPMPPGATIARVDVDEAGSLGQPMPAFADGPPDALALPGFSTGTALVYTAAQGKRDAPKDARLVLRDLGGGPAAPLIAVPPDKAEDSDPSLVPSASPDAHYVLFRSTRSVSAEPPADAQSALFLAACDASGCRDGLLWWPLPETFPVPERPAYCRLRP